MPTLTHYPRITCLLTLFSLIVLSACAPVGPNFTSPDAPSSESFLDPSSSSNDKTDIALKEGETIAEAWWEMFQSEPLNALIRQGLNNNPTITAANARIVQLQESYHAQVGSVTYPSVDASLNANRQKISGAAFGTGSRMYSVYNGSISASYQIDLFGGSSRYLEALQADIDQAQYQRQAARMTLVSNIIAAVIAEATLNEQIDTLDKMVRDSQAQLHLIEQQANFGAKTQVAVLTQRQQLAQMEAQRPPLQKQLQQTRHLLAILVGELPEKSSLPQFKLDSLHLPTTLPVTLPSAFVHQRADILA
ncbi:MAG: TolC family protein, partial [Zetaproteobacteria bacterium]|nr:TolC family protein [Zetaproteobacteria bacterium]